MDIDKFFSNLLGLCDLVAAGSRTIHGQTLKLWKGLADSSVYIYCTILINVGWYHWKREIESGMKRVKETDVR